MLEFSFPFGYIIFVNIANSTNVNIYNMAGREVIFKIDGCISRLDFISFVPGNKIDAQVSWLFN